MPSTTSTHPTPEEASPTKKMNCLVTGSSGGIGSATMQELAAAGHTVHGWDLPELDVTNQAAVTAAFTQLEERHGPVDALIHTAGTLLTDSALEPHPDTLDRSFGINLRGTINVCSTVARHMTARRRGAIVVVSSNAASTPRAGMAAYGASKAAATAWTRTLGLECAPFDVRCNIVSPGSTDTPMLRGMWPAGRDETTRVINGDPEQFRLGIPLGRVADPADIARACNFLISPAARHITMHDLRIDGGATLDQ